MVREKKLKLEDTVNLIQTHIWKEVIATNALCFMYRNKEYEPQMLMLYEHGIKGDYKQ